MIMAAQGSRDAIGMAGEPFGTETATRTVRPGPRRPEGGWTAGRVIALVAGLVVALISLGMLGAGAALLRADQGQREGGYLPVTAASYSTSGYALASRRIALPGVWAIVEPLVGQIRIRVTSADSAEPLFLAVGPAGQVSGFLSGSSYASATGFGGEVVSHHGTAVPGPPAAARIWAAQAAGTGTQTLTWTPGSGDWMVVAMNSDGSAGLTVRANVGISAPLLLSVSIEMLVTGVVLGGLAATLITVPMRLAAIKR
jgi:hypothetical protein